MDDAELQRLIRQAFDTLDMAVRGVATSMDVPSPIIMLEVHVVSAPGTTSAPRTRLLQYRLDRNFRAASERHQASQSRQN